MKLIETHLVLSCPTTNVQVTDTELNEDIC